MRKAIIRNPFTLLFCFLAFSSPFKMLTYSLAFEIWKITRKISTRIAIEKKSFMILNFPQCCRHCRRKGTFELLYFLNPKLLNYLYMMYNTLFHERMIHCR